MWACSGVGEAWAGDSGAAIEDSEMGAGVGDEANSNNSGDGEHRGDKPGDRLGWAEDALVALCDCFEEVKSKL